MGMDRPGIEPSPSRGEASAASKRAGREAVLAGRALGTDSFLLSI